MLGLLEPPWSQKYVSDWLVRIFMHEEAFFLIDIEFDGAMAVPEVLFHMV